METFGLDHETLSAARPTWSTCSLTTLRRRGEGASRPGYDIIVQALSGLMSFTGQPGGEPTKVGVALLDVIRGLYAANAIQSAPRAGRARGEVRVFRSRCTRPEPRRPVNQAANYLIGGVVPQPLGGTRTRTSSRTSCSTRRTDLSSSRRATTVSMFEHARPWSSAARTWSVAPTNAARVRNRDAIVAELGEAFATRTAPQWIAALRPPASRAPVRASTRCSPRGRRGWSRRRRPRRGRCAWSRARSGSTGRLRRCGGLRPDSASTPRRSFGELGVSP